ncbi:MAG: hypothetical protein H5T50_02930 [Nitrososphaeria archaeon]|nr:hypothetical protein [Nitrososphaeria archaeon]
MVAADLGVKLDFNLPSTIEIKDLYVGANSVNLNCRICSISKLKKYIKRDSKEGSFLLLTVFDKTGLVKCYAWDSKAEEIMAMNLKPNEIIQIKKAYVKLDFDNTPSLHIGQKGSVERINKPELTSTLPTLEDFSYSIDDFEPKSTLFCIKGIIDSTPTISTYTRKDGTNVIIHSFLLRGFKSSTQRKRVVLWLTEDISKDIPPIGQMVVIGPLKSKSLATGEIEFHGDEKTFLLPLQQKSGIVSFKSTHNLSLKVLSVGPLIKTKKGSPLVNALVYTDDGQYYILIGLEDVTSFLLSMKPGETIVGSFTFGDKNKLICSKASNIGKKLDVPPFNMTNFYEKISKIKSNIQEKNRIYFLKAVAISQAISKEIQLKNGGRIKLSEILIGDETDEISLIAWRDYAQLIENILPGERLIINGVALKTTPSPCLEVQPYTSIYRVQE